MAMIYYPSCRFTKHYPEASKKALHYMTKNYNVQIAGCCRLNLESITSEDTLVYICNSCVAFFKESTPAKVVSIWELITRDEGFSYPNHSGKCVTLQDCWRAYDNPNLHDTIRKILTFMNIDVVELDRKRENADFCGPSLYQPLPKDYDKYAPIRFVKEAEGLFVSHSEEQKQALMLEHCETIVTGGVVGYCLACVDGINIGGKQGIHLAELVFKNTSK